MARSVENIVNCYEAARSLHAAGKPTWSKTIDIKSILRTDASNETAEHVVNVSKKIATLLRANVPSKFLDYMNARFYESELDYVINDMEGCSITTLTEDFDTPEEMLNNWLEVIYDWADKNRVWLGP